jgi:hypothetical protein
VLPVKLEDLRPNDIRFLRKWVSNGTLQHLGRIDNQVKIKGFRVELDGVATAMEVSDILYSLERQYD